MNQTTQPKRVAFVGAGSMARAHARALSHIAAAPLIVGVFDADRASADDFTVAFGGQSFPSIDALLTEARPEVVHVCTTAGAHFDAARRALLADAHVYVEKPFVETMSDAQALLALAESRKRLICAGHQLLADPAYAALMDRARTLQPVVRIESILSFASPTVRRDAPIRAHMAQLLDVVPHPLYTLIDALERLAPGATIALESCVTTADSVEMLVRAGDVHGRLYVSLVARPVSSTLSIAGENGVLTADFIRGSVNGVANSGTSPIEKILNPIFEGIGLAVRSFAGVVKRLTTHAEYPGLAVLLERFYDAVDFGAVSPTRPAHLLNVVDLYEHIAASVRAVAPAPAASLIGERKPYAGSSGPIVAVTGASGFLGRQLTVALARRGYRVRGIGRGADPGQDGVHEWIRADISRGVPAEAFAGATAVVHAAAATSGGFASHQRHSVESAEHVIDAAVAAGVEHVIHVSSLSVVRPPHGYGEVLDERTELADDARTLGPYTWGKCASEMLIVKKAAAKGIAVRVVRPGALTDRRNPELPGLAGRRLFGDWHLFLGRKGHAFAACDVSLAADVIAWSVEHFADAPPVVNLFDPRMGTRAALLDQMRADGWRGRGVWVPVWVLAAGVSFAKWAMSIGAPRRDRLDVWQVLRPRQFDPTVSADLLASMRGTVKAPAPVDDLPMPVLDGALL